MESQLLLLIVAIGAVSLFQCSGAVNLNMLQSQYPVDSLSKAVSCEKRFPPQATFLAIMRTATNRVGTTLQVYYDYQQAESRVDYSDEVAHTSGSTTSMQSVYKSMQPVYQKRNKDNTHQRGQNRVSSWSSFCALCFSLWWVRVVLTRIVGVKICTDKKQYALAFPPTNPLCSSSPVQQCAPPTDFADSSVSIGKLRINDQTGVFSFLASSYPLSASSSFS